MEKVYVSFDIDGTLIRPEFNDLIWFKEIPELYANKYGVTFEKASELTRKEYEKVGESNIEWYILQCWLDRFKLEVKEEEILQKYADRVELYEETLFVLDKLYGNFLLIASSAMPQSFLDVKLKKNNLFAYFEKTFSSVSDFGMVKKKSVFYEKVCKVLTINTQDLVHTGDHFEGDYLAARKAGVQAFFLDRSNSHPCKNAHVVSDLLEFIHKLKEKGQVFSI